MRDKLNQFVENLQGEFVEVSYREAIYQCMDLAYTWIFALGYPKSTIQNQYAYQVYTNPKTITNEYFELIPNSPDAIPEDGDLVVWSNKYGPAGHIAIALGGGTTSTFMCFEQNNPLGTSAHVQRRNYDHVLGWLRPKVLDLPAIPNEPGKRDQYKIAYQIARPSQDPSDDELDWRVEQNWNPVDVGRDVLISDGSAKTDWLNVWNVPQIVEKEVIKEVPVEKIVEKRIVLPPSSIKGTLANSLFSLAVLVSRSGK
jgi:hypothetical protein